MICVKNQTKLWLFISAAFGLLLMIRSAAAGIEYFGFITIWLLLFVLISRITSSKAENMQILSVLFILSSFGIAVQCLMNQEYLLASSLRFRLAGYILSLIAALLISGFIRILIQKLSARTAEIFWFVMHNALLLFICIAGSWENGTLKYVLLMGRPVQVTVLTKLTSVLFISAVMNDLHLNENLKIIITAGFTLVNAVWFIYMRELGTLLIIMILHLVMIARFIRPVCSLKGKYLMLWCFGALAGVILITAVIPAMGIHSLFFDKLQIRLLGAYDPSLLDPDGSGYSVNAARKAILIGGAFGSALNLHIPEANTDLAFSYVFLRFGIVTALLMMLIYCSFLNALLRCSAEKTPESETAAYGFSMILFIQTFYNLAMCLGVLPVCGINLTFISAGTMDLLTGLIMVFYVINSKGRRKQHA